MLIMSYIGDHVWLITSKQTDPDLRKETISGIIQNSFGFNSQLVNVRMEDSVNEPDARALVWVLIRQLDVDLPMATLEGC